MHLKDKIHQRELALLTYSMSPKLHMSVYISVYMSVHMSVWTGYQSKLLQPLCLITWARGKVLIMFSFILTINPEPGFNPGRDVRHLAEAEPLSSSCMHHSWGCCLFSFLFTNIVQNDTDVQIKAQKY